MTHVLARTTHVPIDATAALREVTAFAESVVQTLRLSRALLSVERAICLDGLEALVAQLCARCLGLERSSAAVLRVHLMAVQAEIDITHAVLTSAKQKAAACPSMTS